MPKITCEAMRFLTIDALMDYGQKLYDRGDYNEASAVFKHILAYDSHQPQALAYIKKIGNKADISDTRALKRAIEAETQTIKTLQDQIMRMRADIAAQSLEKNEIKGIYE